MKYLLVIFVIFSSLSLTSFTVKANEFDQDSDSASAEIEINSENMARDPSAAQDLEQEVDNLLIPEDEPVEAPIEEPMDTEEAE